MGKPTILGSANGQAMEYIKKRREMMVEKMTTIVDAQASILSKHGYDKLCGAANEEFGQCIASLKNAAAGCELCIQPRTFPAVVMIPDRLVSLRRKMQQIGAGGFSDTEKVEDGIRLLEPYMAVNVTLKQMRGGELKNCTSCVPPYSPLTFSETVMLATYYPALFEDVVTVILVEQSVLIMRGCREGNRAGFKITSGNRGLLNQMNEERCQLPICEIRIRR